MSCFRFVCARELVSLFYDIGFSCFYFYFHIIAVNCVFCKRFSDGIVLVVVLFFKIHWTNAKLRNRNSVNLLHHTTGVHYLSGKADCSLKRTAKL